MGSRALRQLAAAGGLRCWQETGAQWERWLVGVRGMPGGGAEGACETGRCAPRRRARATPCPYGAGVFPLSIYCTPGAAPLLHSFGCPRRVCLPRAALSASGPLLPPPPQDDYQQAINVYMEALEHSPENPDILTTLGLLFLRCAPPSLHATGALQLARYGPRHGSVKGSLIMRIATTAAVIGVRHDSGTARIFLLARNVECAGGSSRRGIPGASGCTVVVPYWLRCVNV